MLTFTVLVAFGKPEVDYVHTVFCKLSTSNQEVVRLNITMYDALFMYLFDSLDHLNSDQKNILKVK